MTGKFLKKDLSRLRWIKLNFLISNLHLSIKMFHMNEKIVTTAVA